jgi:uncharacterized protein (DUF1330 family)
MAKGYWIARVDVHNIDGYKEYVAQNGAVFAKYGARFLVRGGKHVPMEGSSRSRNVVLEFKDYETALACYNSPEYVRLVALRSPYAESDLVIIEGYDGPQPYEYGRIAFGFSVIAGRRPGHPRLSCCSDVDARARPRLVRWPDWLPELAAPAIWQGLVRLTCLTCA